MDSALSTLGFVIFGLTFCIYAFLVESQLENGSSRIVSPRPPPRPPSPPLPSPPPPSLSLSPPPPRHRSSEKSKSRARKSLRKRGQSRRTMNGGKKIGLLFAGIAGIMQIGVVGFLVYKRRQLLKMKDIFENGS